MPLTLPPDVVIDEIHGSVTRVTARVDIYEADGVTLWYQNTPVIDGSVSVDATRDERRTVSLTLENVNGVLKSDPDAFWYDKVIKVYRGIKYGSGSTWEQLLGEFFIDSIDETDFPNTVTVSARDQTKKLLTAKFAVSTEFPINQPIEEVIRSIAINGGVAAGKISFPLTGKSTTRAFLFDRMTERWKAMKQIAEAYNYDLYFRADGQLTMTVFQDPANPAVSPSEYTFQPGNGSNRVANASFETPRTAVSTQAAGWTYNYIDGSSNTSTFSLSSLSAYTGARSLTITNPTGVGNSVASNTIKVIAGEIWKFSYAAKADQSTSTGRYFRVAFYTVENGTWAQHITYIDLATNVGFTPDWTVYSGEVTVPSGVTFMRVILIAWRITGVAYTGSFDDISAVRTYPVNKNYGNMADFTRQTADARLYNHVVVTGESADTLPVTAEAENNTVTSPTRIARIGRRTYFYSSPFITTVSQAQEVANRFLKIHALEQYDVNVNAIVVPYLDANIIVDLLDPDPSSSGPTRFLLSNIQIPLSLGLMSANSKRVTIVG